MDLCFVAQRFFVEVIGNLDDLDAPISYQDAEGKEVPMSCRCVNGCNAGCKGECNGECNAE